MKKAIYYNDGSEKAFLVVKEHADGTVDLVAEEGGAVVVEKCPIASSSGQVGYCSVEGMISKAAKDAEAAKAKAAGVAPGWGHATKDGFAAPVRDTREAKAEAAQDARDAAAAERAADRKHK